MRDLEELMEVRMRQMTGVAAAGILVVMAVGLQAQARGSAAQPMSDAIRSSWDGAKGNIASSAADVPDNVYAFKPVDTVRTFGEVVSHVAGANYVFCAAARGEKSPHAENAFDSLATKAAIVKAFAESVAYCDVAYKALTDRTAAEIIDMPFGMGKAARAAALMNNSGHLNEHYGNLVTYMRMKGIVPPSSRR